MATTEVRTYTVEEFMQLPRDDGQRYELAKGELIEMPGPSLRHAKITSTTHRCLGNFTDENNLGDTLINGAYILDPSQPNTVRLPDIAFVAAGRLTSLAYDEAIPLAPDLIVEIVSPSDVWYKVQEKVEEYKRAGVRLIWVILPPSQQVFVYHSDDPDNVTSKMLTINDELDGENVIPGFTLKVSKLFEK